MICRLEHEGKNRVQEFVELVLASMALDVWILRESLLAGLAWNARDLRANMELAQDAPSGETCLVVTTNDMPLSCIPVPSPDCTDPIESFHPTLLYS